MTTQGLKGLILGPLTLGHRIMLMAPYTAPHSNPTTQVFWSALLPESPEDPGIIKAYMEWKPWIMTNHPYHPPLDPYHCTYNYIRTEDEEYQDAWDEEKEGETETIRTGSIITGPEGVAAECLLTPEQKMWYTQSAEAVLHITLLVGAGYEARSLGPMMKTAILEMAAKQDEGMLEDAIFLADLLFKQHKVNCLISMLMVLCPMRKKTGPEQHLAGQNQLGRQRCSGVSSKKEEQKWGNLPTTVAIDSPVTVEPAGENSAKMKCSNCSSFWLINHQPLPHGACAKVLPNWSGKRQGPITWTACCLQLWYQKGYAHIAPLLRSFAAENACPLNGCVITVTFPNTAYTPFITGNSVLGDRPTSGFGSTVNSLSLASIVLQDDSLNVRSSFDAEISDLEHTVSEPPLPSACSSPVRMQESPFPTSSSSQECLVDLIQPVGRHKQVKRKRDSSSGLLVYLENSDDREEKLQERLQEQGQAMLKEQGQAMLQEVHAANAEFLRVFNRIEQNSHSMLGLVDRIVKIVFCPLVGLHTRVTLKVLQRRYDLHLPKRVCNTCQYEWTPDLGDLIRSWPASVNGDTLYATDVFKSFEDLYTVAPGLSRQVFFTDAGTEDTALWEGYCVLGILLIAPLLPPTTVKVFLFPRIILTCTGKIHGDVFQKSFLEYMACQYECQKMTCEEPFSCPACTPKCWLCQWIGIGNSTVPTQRIDEPLFKGPFIMEDSAFTDFVDKVRTNEKVHVVPASGQLLERQQEEPAGLMKRDIAYNYWPYLEKVAKTMPELRPLLSMQPFLSVMHAKAHSTKCEIVWSGRNVEGAGSTAGEEVEMVNSFLSRCAITTKYMTKSDMKSYGNVGENLENTSVSATSLLQQTIKMLEGETQKMKDTCEELGCPEDKVQQWVNDVRDWATNDNTSGDNQSLQMSIEQLFLGLCQKKACLYRQTDSNKIRQLRRKRLREEKTKLLVAIRQYNTGQPPEGNIQEEEVERRLSAEQQTTDMGKSVSILAKQKYLMSTWAKGDLWRRRAIIVREMRQHCLYLRSQADKIRM
ncbi:hypothetical protein F7725_024575 [Dissostichus mawsoni]|uniref:Uncharacterized protein n=1 Tax=Dissostichus mawsoni TaxID=36200 RepID=A0A7J5XZP2_DISMA|nr:hypothetical protein F7725_024575 [Dissostichus mawsoni]